MSIFGTSMLSVILWLTFPLTGMMCAPRRKLIIELDGSQHLEQEEYDAERTAFLESKGYRVLRFWNNQVMNEIEGVLHVIYAALHEEDEGDSEDANSKI
jgi:very-short-patch-repair endonuclease